MMLFKISLKNIRKSYKDYTIYFMTLILGVAIFYLFNSIESQQVMLQLTESTRKMVKLLVRVLDGVSVGVSIILGFLIIYANRFLVRKRKKEFGIYLTLGMSKRSVSMILFGETIIIGAVSLAVGILIGIFGSQFMSILLARLFEADLENFRFVFSRSATEKTILYFGFMFLLVIVFNVIAIGRFKLIELLTANRKNQVIHVRNPFISIVAFGASVIILAYCYYCLMQGIKNMDGTKMCILIALGSIATYLFFWSLAGFFLVILKKNKRIYLKGLNAFVLRQIHNKINTMVFTMTIICLLLFVSIGAISTGVSLRTSLNKDVREAAPVDLSIYTDTNKKMNVSVEKRLDEIHFPMNKMDERLQVYFYTDNKLVMRDLLSTEVVDEVKKQFKSVMWDTNVNIFKQSEYNQLAKMFGYKSITLNENEYATICNFEMFEKYQNKCIKDGLQIKVDGKEYHSKYETCQDGMLVIWSNRSTFNTVVLPDVAFGPDSNMKKTGCIFTANYVTGSKKNMEKTESQVRELLDKNMRDKRFSGIDYLTKSEVKEMSTGLAAVLTFVGLYIGVIFLIASAALLALKELSEAADNKERYALLRKLGAEDNMVDRALFRQIAIFFFMPLSLAIVHSFFGIKFVADIIKMMQGVDLLKPIIITAIIYGIIYFIYFMSTYYGSKRILEE